MKKPKETSQPKKYDYRTSADGEGFMIEVFSGSDWTKVKYMTTEKEAQAWLKGGIPSHPSKRS